MDVAGSLTRLADAGPDPGGVLVGLLCLLAVALTAFVTRRAGRQRRRPAGTPVHRRGSPYRRHRRWSDDGADDGGGDPGGSGGSDGGSGGDPGGGGYGGGCGGGCGGGGS